MGFSIGFGVGPVRYSKRLGGKRRRPARRAGDPLTNISRDLGDLAAMRAAIDAWPREEIKRRHTFGWIVAGFFTVLVLLGGLPGLPIAAAILGGTWWGHRQRWARVAAREQQAADARAREEQRQAARHMTAQDREWLNRHDGRSRY